MPTNMIETVNHGPLIVSSTYWGSEYEAAGKLFCSVNAGAVRVMVPRAGRAVIEECRSSRHAVLSRGPWPEMGLVDAVEILWEDGSDSPFSLHLSNESFDLLPGEPEPGREWTVSLWDLKKGKPHKALERRCHWRRVPRIPWLRPWKAP
jgi:hypothetical protein